VRACVRACARERDAGRAVHPDATTACMRNASRVDARRCASMHMRPRARACVCVRTRTHEASRAIAKTGSRASDRSPALPLRGHSPLCEETSLNRPVALLQREDEISGRRR